MFDRYIRPLIDPPMDRLAGQMEPFSISANAVTLAGFAAGLLAMGAIALESYLLGLLFFALNRLADGLDGAIARRHGVSDLGGYLDIVLDFIIYSGIVFAFALADPEQNALTAAFLIFSFIGTGGSFLAFAIMAAKRGLKTEARGRKSLFYLGGITEGTETIIVLAAFCLLPQYFNQIALVFGVLCWLTTIGRIRIAYAELT